MLSLCRASAATAIAVSFLACANGAELDPGVLPDMSLSGGGTANGPDAALGSGGEQTGSGGIDDGFGGASPSSGAPGFGGVMASGGMRSGSGGAMNQGGAGAPSGSGGKGAGGLTGSGGAVSGGRTGATGMGGANTGGSTGCGMNQKSCNNACVPAAPANGCNGSNCTECPGPAPDHGFLTCNAQGACDFDCLSAYTRSGAACVMGGGSGGSSGTGGSGGTLKCGNDTCKACNLNNTVACCDKLLGNCNCVLSNLTSLLCK